MFETIISIAGIVITIVSLVLSLYLKLKKNKTDKKYYNALAIQGVFNEVAGIVIKAEEIFGSGNGVAKKTWALGQLQIKALQSGVEVSDDVLSDKIEECLSTPEKKKSEEVIL